MNFNFSLKIIISLLLVSSLSMQAIKIEEVDCKTQNEEKNQKDKPQINKTQIIKGSAKIIVGLPLVIHGAAKYYRLARWGGLYSCFIGAFLPLFDRDSKLFSSWVRWHAITGLGIYLTQSGARDLYALKSKNNLSKKDAQHVEIKATT